MNVEYYEKKEQKTKKLRDVKEQLKKIELELLDKDEQIGELYFYKKLYERDEQTANESKKRKRESCLPTTSFSAALRGDELRDRSSYER